MLCVQEAFLMVPFHSMMVLHRTDQSVLLAVTAITQVWSTHIMQFEEYPADGPGALRLAFHEEVADQFVLLGLIPMGLYTIRTDPGTPLNWIRDTVRHTAGRVIAGATPAMVWVLEAVGWIEQ